MTEKCPYEPGTWEYHSWWEMRFAVEIPKAMARLDHQAKVRRHLRDVKHGHDFGKDRRCRCGLTEREYHYQSHFNQAEVCSMVRPITPEELNKLREGKFGPPNKFIVAEVSKNWPDDADPTILCQRFEHIINVNWHRGYKLHSYTLHQLITAPGHMNETIIAVFEKRE